MEGAFYETSATRLGHLIQCSFPFFLAILRGNPLNDFVIGFG